jgi:hypothetical protein
VPPLGSRDTPFFHCKKCAPQAMGSAVRSESNNKIEPRGETFQGAESAAPLQVFRHDAGTQEVIQAVMCFRHLFPSCG